MILVRCIVAIITKQGLACNISFGTMTFDLG